MVLSKDKKRFYLDATRSKRWRSSTSRRRKSIDHFTLSEGRNKRTCIRGMVPDPLDRFLVMVLKVVEKKIDRCEIAPPKLVVYDLKEHKIARTVPWPNNEERENVNVMFSPDGKLLYFFADDVLIYDTADFKQVDTVGTVAADRRRFRAVRLRTARHHLRGAGILQRHLHGEGSGPEPRHHGRRAGEPAGEELRLLAGRAGDATGDRREAGRVLAAPDRKRAYGLLQEIGHYEFWTLRSREAQASSKTDFEGRPRMAVRPSTNGKVLVHLPGGRDDRPLRREQLQVHADDDARRGRDDRSDRRPRRGREADVVFPTAVALSTAGGRLSSQPPAHITAAPES